MKNRFCNLLGISAWALLLTMVCGLTSCKDEYVLDDEKPGWLSKSIYDGLKEDGNYEYYLRLLADPDVNPLNARPLTEVLSRTGSKTVFVANDKAWEEFFRKNAELPETNPWHTATSYENLSVSQKKLLIHTSMLNNAIVMENLSSSSSDITSRGDFMRRYTDMEVTDSITFLPADQLPINYNKDNEEKDYWARFRGGEAMHNGIYLVTDSSLSMMLHFTNEHLTKNNVTDEDFALFMGRERKTGDVHIYDALLEEKDQVAENGYVNVTEKVLIPLPNMAELLRTNGKTNIFSHIIDRWSAPFYNRSVTEAYKNLMAARGIEWKDSIFTKRYFSSKSYGHTALNKDPQGQTFTTKGSKNVFLSFDPGWNAIATNDERWKSSSVKAPQYDMAAMFVPTDEALWDFFSTKGGGFELLKAHYLHVGEPNEIPYVAPTTLDELYQQIDQIPMGVLNSLVNIIMFDSFVGSVPSKMTTLSNDASAQEQIFYQEDWDHIKETMLANNGMVYVMDKVFGPADYTSVAAPAFISPLNKVMNFAIYNGSQVGTTDYMGLNYYAYLKAMQSRFAFFLPSDSAMQYFYDPVSFKTSRSRVLHFFYKNVSSAIPIDFKMYAYDANTGEIGSSYSFETMTQGERTNRLKDILESHTLVLENKNEINSDVDEWYIAKNGAPIHVARKNGKIVSVQGGFQVDNQREGIEGVIGAGNKNVYQEIKGIQENMVTETDSLANGWTYILSSPMIPTKRSVYNVMTNNDKHDNDAYERFYQLTELNEDVILDCGLVDTKVYTTPKEQDKELKKYTVFVDDNGPDFNVQFFNNYRYTIFVPTEMAIDDAISKGLPTWDSILDDYHSLPKDDEDNYILTHEDSIRLQAKITYLINFVRYHFIDNSVFVDKSEMPITDYVTASFDNKKGLFCKVNIRRPSSDVLQVQDVNGGDWQTVEGEYNILARDVSCGGGKPDVKASSMNGITIDGSSFAVLHQIPGVLNHTKLKGGRYDSDWATTEAAVKYLKEFAIH